MIPDTIYTGDNVATMKTWPDACIDLVVTSPPYDNLRTYGALIHAGAVWLVTGSVWFALAEFVLHWGIDFVKCENWTNPHQDQALHVACKVAYVLLG